jgi:hypothetical protein
MRRGAAFQGGGWCQGNPRPAHPVHVR